MANNPLHQFEIQRLVPIEIAGYDLSFTNSSLWMMIGVGLSVSFFFIALQKKALVPGRMQAFAEMFYEFVANMVRENVGTKGKKYFPLIFTLFVVILLGNLLGLIPHSFTYTSHIIVTGVMAALVFIVVTIFGFVNHGLKFLTLFSPSGVPFVLKFLIIPIEFLSFLIRPFTLALRLFANMMAGHMVLKIFAGFSVLMASAGAVGVIMGMLPVFINVGIYALEFLVGLIQAYIFAILSCIYLKDTVDLHH